MRIGFDAKRALNNATGLGNHARILINALMRDFPDEEYHLFSPKAQDRFLNQLNGDFQIHFPITKLQQAIHPWWRSFGVVNDLQQERIEIFHGMSNEIPSGIPKSRIGTVVTIHDLIFLKHRTQYPWIDRQIYEWKTRYAARNADHIIAVSEETKNDLIQFYRVPSKKITVIYPSVDAAFQQGEDATKDTQVIAKHHLPAKYILNVGSFYPRKNQQTLIRAFALIQNNVEEDLVLVGSGSGQKAIESLIASLRLQSRVHLYAHIANEDLPAIYRAASLFVFPSLFEGFGAPVLEALFSHTPVIATGGGAIEEAAGKSSVFINPLSEQEMSEQICRILQNTELQRQMKTAGYAHALTMSDKVFADKVMRVYTAL